MKGHCLGPACAHAKADIQNAAPPFLNRSSGEAFPCLGVDGLGGSEVAMTHVFYMANDARGLLQAIRCRLGAVGDNMLEQLAS